MVLPALLSTKLAAVVGSAVIAVGSFSGVAYASNGAAPGDTLYGLDRALENVGLGDGGLEERFTEVGDLMEDGLVDEGLSHGAEALVEEEDDLDVDGDGEVSEKEEAAGREALFAAAEAVLSHGSEQSLEVRTRVAEKLRMMANSELKGKEFGQAVSEMAHGMKSDAEHGNNGKGSEKAKDKSNNGKANGRSEETEDLEEDESPDEIDGLTEE